MTRRTRSFLLNKTPLRCPACTVETPVQVASLLGNDTPNPSVSKALLQHLLVEFRARWTKQGVQCSKCVKWKPAAHWLLLHEHDVHGPWCLPCLREVVWQDIETEKGLTQDFSVLVLAATNANYRLTGNVIEDVLPEIVKVESILF